MTWALWVWTAFVCLGCAYWVVISALMLRARRALVHIVGEHPPEPKSWPTLSVVIPACNEAANLEAAMETKLVQDYPSAEFVLVDDRSTDDTPHIVDRIAKRDDRVRPVHIAELPEGWLGKVHALHEGTAIASGEWLLFTDADVHLERGAIRRAVAYCEAHDIDHLAMLPGLDGAGLVVDAAVSVFLRLVLIAGRPWAVEDERPETGVGVGAFNLVRRTALAKTEGFEGLKLEVSDDLALGRMLKASGAKPAVANGHGLISVQLYGSLRELVRATERAAIVLEFSPVRTVLYFLFWLGFELAPFAGLAPVGPSWLVVASAFVAVAALGSSVVASRDFGGGVLPGILMPLGSLVLALVTLRAGIVGWARGGLRWRGTHYDAETLLAGRRWSKL